MFSFLDSFKSAYDLLEEGKIHRGLVAAFQKRQWKTVLTHIEWTLKLPGEVTATERSKREHSRLRTLLLRLATQLINLSTSASDARNPVPDALKNSVQSEVSVAYEALAQTCQRLEIVAQQGVDPARLEKELEQEAVNLTQLLEATEDAAAEMARLTLSAGRWQVTDASDKFERLGWAARELTQFNRQMEE